MFKRGAARLPFDGGAALTSGPTISRVEHAASRQDIYRVSEALVAQFIASVANAPKSLILELDPGVPSPPRWFHLLPAADDLRRPVGRLWR
ncbi:hypothetical protein [Massilia psychrophila]|uniref:hypothetical protein n=1 Tax=Massilia psychrophila TaxID=1603353 RepID=UPI00117EDCC2